MKTNKALIDRFFTFLFQPAIILLILAFMLGHSLDYDSWWHLAQGRWMVENGRLYTADTFSYTRPGAPWNHPGNFYDIPMFLVFRWFGYAGVDIFASLILGATFLILWHQLKTTPLRRSFLVGFSILLTISFWSARPAMLSLLLSAIVMVILEHDARKPAQWIYILPLLTLVWVNIHSYFIVGFILTAIKLIDYLKDAAGLKRLERVLGLMGLASLVNPFGYQVYEASLRTAGRAAEQLMIMEWQSPNFHQPYAQIFLLAILFTLVVLAYAKRPFTPSRIVLLVVFIGMGLISNRNISTFGIIAPIIWYDLLGWRQNEISPQRSWVSAVQAGAALGFLLFAGAFFTSALNAALRNPVDASRFPAAAAAYLKETRPPGNLFNGYNWGGYLTWALPEYPVFVDGRSNIFGDEIIQQSVTLELTQPGWQSVLAEWNIHLVLTEANSPLSAALQTAGWQACYHDQLAAVLVDARQCP